MFQDFWRQLKGLVEEPLRVDALSVAQRLRAERQAEAEALGLSEPGEPEYLVAGRARAVALLGERLATGHREWHRPPFVLAEWARMHPDPNQRAAPMASAAVAEEQARVVRPMKRRRKV